MKVRQWIGMFLTLAGAFSLSNGTSGLSEALGSMILVLGGGALWLIPAKKKQKESR